MLSGAAENPNVTKAGGERERERERRRTCICGSLDMGEEEDGEAACMVGELLAIHTHRFRVWLLGFLSRIALRVRVRGIGVLVTCTHEDSQSFELTRQLERLVYCRTNLPMLRAMHAMENAR